VVRGFSLVRRDTSWLASSVLTDGLGGSKKAMVMFLVVLLAALWLLGMVTTATFGGWLHILLVIAVVFLLIRLIRGEPV